MQSPASTETTSNQATSRSQEPELIPHSFLELAAGQTAHAFRILSCFCTAIRSEKQMVLSAEVRRGDPTPFEALRAMMETVLNHQVR